MITAYEIILWIVLVLSIYWLMVETRWLRVRLIAGRIIAQPTEQSIIELVPVIIAVGLVMSVVIHAFGKSGGNKSHWWQRLFAKLHKPTPFESLYVLMTYIVVSTFIKNIITPTKNIK